MREDFGFDETFLKFTEARRVLEANLESRA
jgi:hypothetical protein